MPTPDLMPPCDSLTSRLANTAPDSALPPIRCLAPDASSTVVLWTAKPNLTTLIPSIVSSPRPWTGVHQLPHPRRHDLKRPSTSRQRPPLPVTAFRENHRGDVHRLGEWSRFPPRPRTDERAVSAPIAPLTPPTRGPATLANSGGSLGSRHGSMWRGASSPKCQGETSFRGLRSLCDRSPPPVPNHRPVDVGLGAGPRIPPRIPSRLRTRP